MRNGVPYVPKVFYKTATDELDYEFDFTPWLRGLATISDFEVSAADGSGFEVSKIGHTTTHATLLVKGGNAGKHLVSCTITTNQTPPRVVTRSIYVVVQTM